MTSRSVAARESRAAVIDASVPLVTNRMRSTLGTRATTSAASADSWSEDKPVAPPRSTAPMSAFVTGTLAWPRITEPNPWM
jgi:hypothetical protein